VQKDTSGRKKGFMFPVIVLKTNVVDLFALFAGAFIAWG
jgi:hypothetical protein